MHEESRREELSKCKSSPQVAVEAAVLESEIATNRIRGRGDDHIARSARDAADAADGSGPYPGSRTARPTCRRRSGSSPDRWDDEAAHAHLLVDAEVERQLGLHVIVLPSGQAGGPSTVPRGAVQGGGTRVGWAVPPPSPGAGCGRGPRRCARLACRRPKGRSTFGRGFAVTTRQHDVVLGVANQCCPSVS